MRPHEAHRESAPKNISAHVITISTSRYESSRAGQSLTDESGDVAELQAKRAGFNVKGRSLVPDDAGMIRKEVVKFLDGDDDLLLLTGGTGLARKDVTIETVREFFEKELDGFGEILRRKSYDKVGAASALTRATAGVAKGKLILAMPGSPDAVKTALESFAKEIPHALFVARS